MSDSKNKPSWGRLVRRIVVPTFALGAVTIDFHGDPTLYFSYFTVLTNLGIAFWYLAALFVPRPLERASALRLTLTVYGLVTLLVYWIFLAPTHHPEGWNFWANLVLHLGVPLAMAAEDMLVPWPRLKLLTPLWSLLFLVVYVAFVLVRGANTGWYPYFFFDQAQWGGWGLLFAFLGFLLAVFVALAYGWRVAVHRRQRAATAK